MSDNKPSNSSADQNNEPPSFEKIEAVAFNPEGSADKAEQSTAKTKESPPPREIDDRPGKSIWFALFILVAMAIFVLFYEPAEPSEEELAALEEAKTSLEQQAEDAEKAKAEAEKAALPILDAETVLQLRKTAESISQTLAEKLLILETQSVKRWAEEDYLALIEQVNQGQSRFNQREYAEAAEVFEQAIPLADALLARAPAVLAEALANGQQAIEDGNSEQAEYAYLLALAVEAENPVAKRGLERSKTLDQVLELVRNAKDKEADDALPQARDDFKAALVLDPDTKEAQDGLQRVEKTMRDRAFQEQISQALNALETNDFSKAEAAYKKADAILPNSVEVQEGLADIKARKQAIAVAQHKRKGSALEALEQWHGAKAEYQKALAIDPSLEFAKAGLKRSTSRARLDDDLQSFIDKPESLFDKKIQANADTALAYAKKLTSPGRRLRSQIAQTTTLLREARTPINVQLRSDGRTDVLFYKVGKLGMFTDKNLAVMPGDYTILGRCAGYRDSRTQLALRPGQNSVNLFIRCTEQL